MTVSKKQLLEENQALREELEDLKDLRQELYKVNHDQFEELTRLIKDKLEVIGQRLTDLELSLTEQEYKELVKPLQELL